MKIHTFPTQKLLSLIQRKKTQNFMYNLFSDNELLLIADWWKWIKMKLHIFLNKRRQQQQQQPRRYEQ